MASTKCGAKVTQDLTWRGEECFVLHATDRFGHEVVTERLWDVGVPVSTDADLFTAWAWDDDPPRPFLVTRVWTEGKPISEKDFERLVAERHAYPEGDLGT